MHPVKPFAFRSRWTASPWLLPLNRGWGIRDSRFVIRNSRSAKKRPSGPWSQSEQKSHYLPQCLSAHRCELLHHVCPLSSCGNRARVAPISYRQSLLQISKRSVSFSCIRHPQRSIHVSANVPAPFIIFLPLEIDGAVPGRSGVSRMVHTSGLRTVAEACRRTD